MSVIKICNKCGKDITNERKTETWLSEADKMTESNFHLFLPFDRNIINTEEYDKIHSTVIITNFVCFKFTKRGLLKTSKEISGKLASTDMYISIDFGIDKQADYCFQCIKKAFKIFIDELFEKIKRNSDNER